MGTCENKPEMNIYIQSLLKKSGVEIVAEFSSLDKEGKRNIYLKILFAAKNAILDSDCNTLQKLGCILDSLKSNVSNETLQDFCNSTDNPFRNTNMILLACKHGKIDVVRLLFEEKNRAFCNLNSKDCSMLSILPDTLDGDSHNAIYYAIRSGETDLFRLLVEQWPDNYFQAHKGELDVILSNVYNEMKLKNILLTTETEILIKYYLIENRFFHEKSDKSEASVTSVRRKIEQRIIMLLEDIENLLKTECLEMDNTFLVQIQFIAKNIHALKRLLKMTYDRLPWEEIEFCLVLFVRCNLKFQKRNFFYNSILTVSRILSHLKNFARCLSIKKSTILKTNAKTLSQFPKNFKNQKRDDIVSKILNYHPYFNELYDDYTQVRDMHSLENIKEYIDIALSTDPEDKEGQMALMRALQVIGEHLKNTVETPKLSNLTSELLFYSLPKTTRDVIKDLRNSLSHSKSLYKRSEIKKSNSFYFSKIKNDLKKLDSFITEILYKNRTKSIVGLLNKIFSCKDLKDIRQIIDTFDTEEAREIFLRYPISEELEQLEMLIDELRNKVVDKTYAVEELFDAINFEIIQEKNKLINAGVQFLIAFNAISCILNKLKDDQIDEKDIQFTKLKAEESLLSINMVATKDEHSSLRKINDLLIGLLYKINSRISAENVNDVVSIAVKIYVILEYKVDNIKWIEEFRYKLKLNDRKRENEMIQDNYKIQFYGTLSLLKEVLEENGLIKQNNNLIQKLYLFKNDKNLQAAIEMIVIDIFSILSNLGYLTDNPLYVENKVTLIGKNLRNHLVHFNSLNDILMEETFIDTALNAAKIGAEVTLEQSKKIDKVLLNDGSKLKSFQEEALLIIHNQEALFSALAQGNLHEVKNCLATGADIFGRDMNSWTTLHYASKGPCLEVVRFILEQGVDIRAKDIKGFTVLHVASLFGRVETVKFFLTFEKLSIKDETNDGWTPLHLAIQYGHKEVVEILLQNDSCTSFINGHHSPMWCAIWYEKEEIIEILLDRIENVNASVITGGYTALHIAAEKGLTKIVNILLNKGANVNKKSDDQLLPLHLASMRGKTDIVMILLSQKSDIDAETIDGHTPLIFAAERGRNEVVDLLIKHKAKVNIADKTMKWTPLMLVVKNEDLQMTEYLLNNFADVEAQDFLGQTALHFAVSKDSENIVRALLEKKANITTTDDEGKTALHKAAERGHEKIVKILIQKGSNINAVDRNLRTPLHYAAEKGFLEVAKALIDTKILNIDAKDRDGSTALHISIHHKHKKVLKHLIDCKANINELDLKKQSPLHLAIKSCNDEIIQLFIGKGKGVEDININASTLLQMSVISGNKTFTEEMIKNGCDCLIRDEEGRTLLHLAAESNQIEIIKFLAKRMSTISDWKDRNGHFPLYYAVKNNYKNAVLELIDNDISVEEYESIEMAVRSGYKDILDILLKNCKRDFITNLCKFRLQNGFSLLHLATVNGHLSVVETLLKFRIDIDATVPENGMTSLHLAIKYDHTEIVEMLVRKKANVNIQSEDGHTPLHLASADGSIRMIEILLNVGAKLSIRNKSNQLPVELAAANGHLIAVKILLETQEENLNNLLHIAAKNGNLEIAKYLIGKNCDLHFRDSMHLKPIHVAVQHGHLDIVKLFLKSDESLKDNTLLHLAVSRSNLDLVKFLIDEKVDLNAPDENGNTSVHLAAIHGNKNILEILLHNGAYYDSLNNLNRQAEDLAQGGHIKKALQKTKILFKSKFPIDVEVCIEEGAFVNAKRRDGSTPLHFAAWKGLEWMVKILLDKGANPNVIGKNGSTPLHYASKYATKEVVEMLLASGAIYNALDDSKNPPIEYSEREDIKDLLNLLDESFKGVQACIQTPPTFLRELKRSSSICALMRAKNRHMKTLVVAAISSDFPFVEQLKSIKQEDPSDKFETVEKLMEEEKFEESLFILKEILKKREAIIGPDNPGCFDIKEKIAMVLYKQQHYADAMKIFDEIYKKWKEALHIETEDTLRIRGLIATTFHKQGENEQALDIFREIEVKMKKDFGEDHGEYLKIQTHKAAVLHALGRHEEALRTNSMIYEKYKNKLGENDPLTLTVENNMGIILVNQGKKDEALRTFGKVYVGRKKVLGKTHSDTLRTFHNMVNVLSSLGKWDEAHEAYQDVLCMQKDTLATDHLDILRTQVKIADLHFNQRNYLNALKIYLEVQDKMIAKLGHDNPEILDTEEKISSIHQQLFLDGIIGIGRLNQVYLNVNDTIEADSKMAIESLIRTGVDVNYKTSNGFSMLHFAVNDNKKDKVVSLLSSGADIFLVSSKGNTPLHIAASKGLSEIAEILLEHVKQHHYSKLNDFIDAKTVVKGSTALHVAANERTAKVLLKYGASYNLQNDIGQTPVELATDWHIINLLRLTDKVFKDAACCNSQLIRGIGFLHFMGFSAIFFARNRDRLTLVEVAQQANNKILEHVLLAMMKTPNQFILPDSKIHLL
ncbi:uncharacterized protein LOC129989212 [Argiope bruennichi]|uniref:uncharacterized protein LOC129989212 n=1 Tax=Argiope bruennichi TaxID=94029 RepID=UPI00249408D4|nr:uncharacterized protein LOC129989212 [Argiope bruennichi]